MFKKLRHLLRPDAARSRPAVPPGHRVYAVGDIHGRADLFSRLIEAIEDDNGRRNAAAGPGHGGPVQTTVILLGDLIDRGPDSRGVLDLARHWGQHRTVRILMGNHEEMLLKAIDSLDVLRHFLRFGGRETVLSFGVDEQTYHEASFEQVQAMLLSRIPPPTIDFIRDFENSILIGDYLFVHAGIRPGVPLDTQSIQDLRWIREPFLSSTQGHGAVIVHGHTITQEAEVRANRLGIDTGAYQSGKLTALGLEGQERWLIEATGDEDTKAITISTQPLK
jgi:serine/threonine protein phosphatase 1